MLRDFRTELSPMIRLASPLVLAELGWMSMQIVDTMMVGRLPNSAEAIGAVSLGSILYYAIAIFGTGLMLGLDTLVSQSYGAGDIQDCHHSLINGVYLSLGLAPLLMGIVWLCGPLLRHAGIAPAVLGPAIQYLNALNWGLLPLLLYFAFRRYLQAINRPTPVMFALLTANLVNLVGNWALIYGHLGAPAMGTVGSGWSTCIARVYMAGVLLLYIVYYDHRHRTGLRQTPGRPSFARIRQLLHLGLPAGAQFGLEVAVFAVATALVGRLGAVPLASHQIAMTMVGFTYMVPLGVSSAAAVRVGQALGRGDAHAARVSGWTAMSLGAGFMSCMALALIVVPGPLVRLYTPNPDLIGAASQLLFIAAFFQLFDGLQTVATGALRGAGDTRTPMVCHLAGYWLIGLPVGWALCFRFGWGAPGMWSGLSLGLILIGSALLIAWYRRSHPARGRLAAVASSSAVSPNNPR